VGSVLAQVREVGPRARRQDRDRGVVDVQLSKILKWKTPQRHLTNFEHFYTSNTGRHSALRYLRLIEFEKTAGFAKLRVI
jgi:hypothetical protein